ncbi:MAG: beta-propeller fold lactonase family protein, partial [Planctomycetota bacterium]|nr:beta-propeller fold lactonase family protein [Planctomycetota bacterium]
MTFQLILELNTNERDGDIIFNYVDLDTGTGFVDLANGASATVGGKDGGDRPQGVRQVSFNLLNNLVGDSKAIVARSGFSDGDDRLNGGMGNDILITTSGNDLLDGDAGIDELVVDQLRFPFPSVNNVFDSSITSTTTESSGQTSEHETVYSNIEKLRLGFGPGDQTVTLDLDGLPMELTKVSIDTRGPTASDSLTILGTSDNENFVLTGNAVTVGTRTIELAGVEDLVLDISRGGVDTILVKQDFSGSARQVVVAGDSADDTVSLQSTLNPQFVNLFASDGVYNASLHENLFGNLLLDEILQNGVQDGEGNTITNQLDPDQLIVSPDGSRVYVAAADSSSLVVYDRDRVTGNLTFVESLANNGMDFFGSTITGLDGASNVIVSADGRHVYVASEIDRTVAFFVHHPGDTQLTFISSTILDGMGNTFNIVLPSSMAFSRDESILMVASETGDLIAFLEVTPNGDLISKGVLADGDSNPDLSVIDGLGGASSIAVSPDGRHLYVTGATDNSIAVFDQSIFQGEHDEVTLPLFVESLTNGGQDAAGNPVSGILGATSVTVSPDGNHVYVTGASSNSIAVFSRDSVTGVLTFVESLTDMASDQLGNTVTNLLSPLSVTTNPEGFLVYVAASGSNAVTIFERDFGTGVLTFLETLAASETDGAGTPISGLNNVSSVFASLDGLHVYASGTADNAVVRFNVPRVLSVTTDGAAAVSVTTSDADDQIVVGIDGLPTTASIDSGGSVDDVVTIMGTLNNDTINVNGGTLTFGGTTLTLINSEFLNVFTDSGDDTVNVTASTTGPHLSVNGGAPPAAGDTLNIDVLAAE